MISSGIDECGLGVVAGPIVICGVRSRDADLARAVSLTTIRDSKRMTPAEITQAAKVIMGTQGVAFHMVMISPWRVDRDGAGPSYMGGFRLLTRLLAQHGPRGKAIIDGSRGGFGFTAIPKAEDKYLAVGAASILGKYHRDLYMTRLHALYPYYGWDENAGYPTPAHKKAIQRWGFSPHHRLSVKIKL